MLSLEIDNNSTLLINKIETELTAIRNYINTNRAWNIYLSNERDWAKICSCLDTTGDCVWGIESYIKDIFPKDSGLQYIYIYGTLQCLYVSDDATSDLFNSFKSFHPEITTYPKNERLRNYRNDITGHPTNRGKTHSTFISRPTITKHQFEIFKYGKNINSHEYINLSEIIHTHLSHLLENLSALNSKLVHLKQKHMQKFSKQLLTKILHPSLNSMFGNIISTHDIKKSLFHLEFIESSYNKFQKSLKERDELSDSLEEDLNIFNTAINYLKKSLLSEKINIHKYRIHAKFLITQHKEFEELAKELDKDYATPTE